MTTVLTLHEKFHCSCGDTVYILSFYCVVSFIINGYILDGQCNSVLMILSDETLIFWKRFIILGENKYTLKMPILNEFLFHFLRNMVTITVVIGCDFYF